MTDALPADRRRRLEDLFERAIALPAAKRARFVARTCGTDAALRQELQRLLAGHAGTDHLQRLSGGIMPPRTGEADAP